MEGIVNCKGDSVQLRDQLIASTMQLPDAWCAQSMYVCMCVCIAIILMCCAQVN